MPVQGLTPEEQHELHEKKRQAIEYYQQNNVPQEMENALNDMFFTQPECVFGYVAKYFEQYANAPYISHLKAVEIPDSRGVTCFRVDLLCRYMNEDKLFVSYQFPLDGKVPEHAKPEEKEQDEEERKKDVEFGMSHINEGGMLQAAVLENWDPQQQKLCDQKLINCLENLELERRKLEAEEAAQQEEQDGAAAAKSEPPKSANKKGGSAGKGKKGKEVVVIPDEEPEQLLSGCCAVSAVSMAIAQAGAVAAKLNVFEHIIQVAGREIIDGFRVSLPMVTILCGGKSSPGKSNCIKEYMLVPIIPEIQEADDADEDAPVPSPTPEMDMLATKMLRDVMAVHQWIMRSQTQKSGSAGKLINEMGCPNVALDRPEQGFEIINEALSGLDLKDSYGFALNLAGHEVFDYDKGKYDVIAGSQKTADELADFYDDMVSKCPQIMALVDPMRSVERQAWMKLCSKVSEKCLVIGDRALPRPGLVLPHDLPVDLQTSGWTARAESRNTLTELIFCTNKMAQADVETVVSGGLSDTDSIFLADLAVGLQARYLRIGGPGRAERLAKLRRLADIEQILLDRDLLLSWPPLSPPKLELPPSTEEPAEEHEQPRTGSQKKKK